MARCTWDLMMIDANRGDESRGRAFTIAVAAVAVPRLTSLTQAILYMAATARSTCCCTKWGKLSWRLSKFGLRHEPSGPKIRKVAAPKKL